MHWRHVTERQAVAECKYSELKKICIWTKTNAWIGSLCRSAYEFVFVFEKGKGRHINNVDLGRYGRNRTTVWSYADWSYADWSYADWSYAGMNSFGADRDTLVAAHPTVKPVAPVQNAIPKAYSAAEVRSSLKS